MGIKTANQIKDEMIQKMGLEFGSLFYSLHNEIIWLTYQWIEFKELYGTKESRIELMNEAAPFFFYTVQKVLWNHLLLGVTRITDPIKSTGKKNVTLKAIMLYIEDETFKSEFEYDLEEICGTSDFCRDWRNRKISHIDYNLSTQKPDAEPLKKATREKFRITLEKIHALYNKVHQEYLGSSQAFYLMNSFRGAKALLHKIEDGITYDKVVHQRKLNGDWDWNDKSESRV